MESSNLVKYDEGLIHRVNNAIGITNKLLNVELRPIYAIHLDDHRIFTEGIKKWLVPFFPNMKIDSFIEPHSALNQLKHCLENEIKIDFVISDLRHPEPDGFKFSKIVREIEKHYNRRIPILIISIYIDEPLWPKMIEFLDDGTWDKVLPKTVSEIELRATIKEILK